MTPKTKKEWETLASEAHETGRKAARKEFQKQGDSGNNYTVKFDDLPKPHKLGFIAMVKAIAKKLNSK